VNRDEDPLFGLKENVIIGKLIPAGTGFRGGPFAPEFEEGEEGAAVELGDGELAAVIEEITEDTVVQDLEDNPPDES